ncbi:MAG: DUF2132 domain-containing protein [Elusimicrobia bacterium]|nr:DUF2132 domain-containing protein [Elusimicrobiota bacterium]
MNTSGNKDLLHGVTLEMILTRLVERYGWPEMSRRIRINCFAKDPSIKSSLTFLRRTPWAREKVEGLYRWTFRASQGHDVHRGPRGDV